MRGSSHPEDWSSRGSWTHGLCGRQSSRRANPARKISDKQIDTLIGSQGQNKPSGREREFRKDRIAIWFLSVMMAMTFLMVVLLGIQVRISRPKNATPTESAWYRQALPLFKILSRDRPGSILPGDFYRPCTN
jgi:hypothetical protein